jgi:hypothetical protein
MHPLNDYFSKGFLIEKLSSGVRPEIPDPGSDQNNYFLKGFSMKKLSSGVRPEIPDPGSDQNNYF